MNYTIERDGYNVKLSIALTATEWDSAIEKAYQKTKHKYKVPGFRPGKAPRKFLENAYGQGIFFDEAFNECFPEYYSEIVEKEKLDPIDRPDVDFEDISEEGVKFSASVVVSPEVKLGEYKGLEVERTIYTLGADEVDKELETVRNRNARKVEVTDREVKEGDFATIDYSGSVDGVKFEGGTAQKHELEIGSNSFIPGFEAQVVGMKVGEERDIKVTFPAEYHAENLKGKEAVFAIKLHEIKVKEYPELNDEFSKDVSEFDTLEEYKASIEKRLTEGHTKRTEVEAENALINRVAENVEVDIPNVMVEQQIDRFIEDFQYRLYYQGMKLEDYFKYTGSTMEDMRKSRREEAQKAVKVRLAIEAIIEKEGVKLEDEDVDAKIAELAEKAKKSVEDYKASIDDRQMNYIKNDAIMDKLLKLLKDANTFVDKKPEVKEEKKSTKKAKEAAAE